MEGHIWSSTKTLDILCILRSLYCFQSTDTLLSWYNLMYEFHSARFEKAKQFEIRAWLRTSSGENRMKTFSSAIQIGWFIYWYGAERAFKWLFQKRLDAVFVFYMIQNCIVKSSELHKKYAIFKCPKMTSSRSKAFGLRQPPTTYVLFLRGELHSTEVKPSAMSWIEAGVYELNLIK